MDRRSSQTATMLDLNYTGMRLRYTTPGQVCHQWSRVDVIARGQNEVLIADLPCKPVYDIATLAENTRFSGDYVRICGVRIDPISPRQKMQLWELHARIASIEPFEDESKTI